MPGSFQASLNSADLQGGEHLIDGNTVSAIVKQSISGQSSLTALAGGGLSANTPVCSLYINEFTTVASANDSCQLPLAIAGVEVTVINSGAQNLRVYANNGNPNNLNASGTPIADNIVALGGGNNTYVTLAANAFGVFSCPVLGKWKSQNV